MKLNIEFPKYSGNSIGENMPEQNSMIKDLFLLLRKPTLWQRSCEPFWDDEHISKGMLEAHLNPDWDALLSGLPVLSGKAVKYLTWAVDRDFTPSGCQMQVMT